MKYWLLAALALGMCLVNVWHTCHDVQDYGGTDLRVRVVGARALVRGINPYTIEETDDLDPALRDPDQSGLSRCTYPQTLLYFYAPLSSLEYPAQRTIWATLEWSAFVGSVVLLCGCIPLPRARFWFAVSAVGLFGSSFFWRLHVERGQYYIFVVLLISLGMYLHLNRRQHVPTGVFWGMAICLRPTVVFFVLPLLTRSQRRVGLTAIATAIVVVACATWFGELDYWFDYLKLSRAWEHSVLGAVVEGSEDVARTTRPTDGYNTAMLEGYAANLTFDSLAQSLQTMLNFRIDPAMIARAGKVVWLIVLTTIWILQFRMHKHRPAQFGHQLLVGVCLMLVTDYFLPIRIEYADIMFLIPMAMLTPSMMHKEYRVLTLLFLFAMLIPFAPLGSLPFNASAPAAMLRSCVAVYLLVRFTVCGIPDSHLSE